MTFSNRLRSIAADASRLALGAALGVGLVVALAGSPARAWAQAAEAPAVSSGVVPAEGDGPALWVIRDEDSTLYLFGTVHVLKPDTAWGSAKVDAAFDSASDIWFEISNPDDQAAILPLIQQHGISPDRPLSSLLTAEEFAELDAAAATIGASGQQMDVFRPWFAGLTLSVAPLAKAGYDPNSGVELVLKARAEAAGKPVHGFETLDKQVRILAGMSEEVQLGFLRETLEDFENAATILDGMVEDWSTGDVEGLNQTVVAEMKTDAPEVYEALLVHRNTDWADQIQTLLEGSGTAFIAVGAAHLTGDDSVQAILAQRGVEAVRQ